MPDPIVSLDSLNDVHLEPKWRVCEMVNYVEGLKKVKNSSTRKTTEVFSFAAGDHRGTVMLFEAWEDKGIICNAVIREAKKHYLSNGTLRADTFLHKHRQANSPFRCCLNYGSEITRFTDEDTKTEKISKVGYLSKMITTRDVTDYSVLNQERYYVFAKISKAAQTNNLFKVCPGSDCYRKTIFCWGNTPNCPRCNELDDDFVWNFRVLLTLHYDGSEMEAAIFSGEAEKLFGITGDEAAGIKKNDPSAFSQVFKKTENKDFVFLLRPHLYNGRIVFTVVEHFER